MSMNFEVITVRGTEFSIFPTKTGSPAVFAYDGKGSDGEPLVREVGDLAVRPVRASELLSEFPAGACVMLAEPSESSTPDPLAETVTVGGREYAISRFADGVPVVYECRSEDRYGTVLSKFGERAGRSFDASLFKHALCPGVVLIVCAPTA
jgi:hypothetical protein